MSETVAHLGMRPWVRPLGWGCVGCCCGQDWRSTLTATTRAAAVGTQAHDLPGHGTERVPGPERLSSQPPDDDHAGQCLDAAAQRPAHQRDGTGRETRDQANDAFGGHPGQRCSGEPACVTGNAQPPLIWASCGGGRAVFTAGICCWDRRPRTGPARWPVHHRRSPIVIRRAHPAWCRVTG